MNNNLAGFLAEARWHGSPFMVGMTFGGDDLVHRSAIENLYAAAVGRLAGVVRSW